MNKRLINRLMHERVSGLVSSGVYFFRGDFENVLSGAVLEYVPRGVYCYAFRFPLFDFLGPNLTYSDRLPGKPFIAKGEMNEQAIVDLLLEAPEIQKIFAAQAPAGLAEFITYLVDSGKGIRAPHARLIYAASLILAGEQAQAEEVMDGLLSRLHPVDVPHFHSLRESLQRGPESTSALLEQMRQKNLHAFGLACK